MSQAEEQAAFPVEEGQVWQQGSHTWVCSDLMDSTLYDAAVRDCSQPTLMYTDPPWGQGLANSFRTKAHLPRATYDWKDIYQRVAALGHGWNVPIFVECSAIDTQFGMVVPHLITPPDSDPRDTVRAYWEASYMGDGRCGVYYCGHTRLPEGFSLTGCKGFETVRTTLGIYSPGVVLDPCSGLGGISLEAQKQGWASVCNELNPQRISQAMFRMRKLTGIEPTKESA